MTEMPPLPGPTSTLPTVYRYYGRDKRLLYVGKTINPGRRGSQHRDSKEWWSEVGLVVFEHLPRGSTGQDLDRAERRAIGRGWPLHNQQHNPRVKAWVRDQYPSETDEGVFSYDLVERFARYKPSTLGPVPLSRQEYRELENTGARPEVDRYPEETKVGQDYNRYRPDLAPMPSANLRPAIVPLAIGGVVALTLIIGVLFAALL